MNHRQYAAVARDPHAAMLAAGVNGIGPLRSWTALLERPSATPVLKGARH